MDNGVLVFLALVVGIGATFPAFPFSWNKVPLWVDFGAHSPTLMTTEQAKFVAEHYEIVSLEKCFGRPFSPPLNFSTEQAFNYTTHQLKGFNKNLQVLFYWNLEVRLPRCYTADQYYAKHVQQWGWRDDNGKLINPHNTAAIPDYTKKVVRDWWVGVVLHVMKMTGESLVAGVFADGSGSFDWHNHPPKGHVISKKRSDAWEHAKNLLLGELRDALHKVSSNKAVIGNGLSEYPNSITPDHSLGQLPYVDGVCVEHFGAFEDVERSRQLPVSGPTSSLYMPPWLDLKPAQYQSAAPPAGYKADNSEATWKWNSTKLLNWFKVIDYTLKQKKSVILKTWIGPEVTPINGFGPSWPENTPKTGAAVAALSKDMKYLGFPLASYLCLMTEGIYLSYAWWYNVDNVVPCANDCTVPQGFYPEFMHEFGKPTTPPQWTSKWVCKRDFEHASVVVDVEAVTGDVKFH